MSNYLLKNIAWVIDENKPAVYPIVFNKNKTKIKLIESGKILPIENDNIYFAAGKVLGVNYAIDSYSFFDNNRELLPFNIKSLLSEKNPYIVCSAVESQNRGLIQTYLEATIMSEKNIVKIAKRLELKLVKKEIAKLSKKCNNLKKSIKGKKEPVISQSLLQPIDFL